MRLQIAAIACALVLAVPAAHAQTSASQWQIQTSVSPIDDSTNVLAYVEAEDVVQNRFGQPQQLHLILQCQESKTGFFIRFDDFYMSDFRERGVVILRADKNKARQVFMHASSDHKALGLEGRQAIRLIKSIESARELVIAAFPVNEAEVRAVFSLNRAADAIQTVRKACSW